MKRCPQCARCFRCCDCRELVAWVIGPRACGHVGIGEVEREQRRTQAEINAASARKRNEADPMIRAGVPYPEIALAFDVCEGTVQNWARRIKADLWRPATRDFSRFPIRRTAETKPRARRKTESTTR